MMGRWKDLGTFRSPASGASLPALARQKGTTSDVWAVRLAGGATYVPIRWLSRLLVAIYFRRPTVRRAERFPARGPVLLVANHPATWTDVVLLESAFSRRLHFLAQERLFHPLPRAWILWLHGALPVTKHEDAPEKPDRNQATFRRCRELLARGEVVAVFPEGLSGEDRALARFRSGAARIALDALLAGRPLAVAPVGLHYADRTSFRSDVVVQVGRPLRLAAVPAEGESAAWIERLTAAVRRAIEGLIVEVPDPALRPLVEELAPILPAGRDGDPGAFRRSRVVLRTLGARRRRGDGPSWERRIRRCARLRARLGIAYQDLDPASLGRRRLALLLLAAPVALAGALIHAPAVLLTELGARRYRDPERVTLARIVAGMVWFFAWYAALGAALTLATGAPSAALAWLAAAAMLGWVALLWSDGWPRLRGRLRVVLLERRHPSLVGRLRGERQALRSWLDSPTRAEADSGTVARISP